MILQTESAFASASLCPAAAITAKAVSMPRPGILTSGQPYTEDTEKEIIEALEPSYIEGFSLLGGEPFEPENQPVLAELLQKIKATYPEKNVWCYSGYLFDSDLQPGGSVYTEFTDQMLEMIDVLVDGEFIEAQKDITLRFRGSSNQRIIDVKKSREAQQVVLSPLQKKREF